MHVAKCPRLGIACQPALDGARDMDALLLGRRRNSGAGFPRQTLMVAVSPMTKMSAFPGTLKSAATLTRPALSAGAPSHAAAGDARTPAAQRITSAAIERSPTTTPLELQLVTADPTCTSTPRRSKARCAYADRSGAKLGKMRGPASISSTRA